MFKIKIIAAIFLAGVAILSIFLLSSKSCQRLNCININEDKSYKIKQVYEDNPYIFRALYEKGDGLLKVEIRSNSTKLESDQNIQSQITKIKGLFEDAAAPYPGEISDQIHCSDEFKPIYSQKQQNGIQISYFTAFVNNRLTFGSCSADQIRYQDTMLMFYCPRQKNFIQLEILLPLKTYLKDPQTAQKTLDSIGCKK